MIAQPRTGGRTWRRHWPLAVCMGGSLFGSSGCVPGKIADLLQPPAAPVEAQAGYGTLAVTVEWPAEPGRERAGYPAQFIPNSTGRVDVTVKTSGGTVMGFGSVSRPSGQNSVTRSIKVKTGNNYTVDAKAYPSAAAGTAIAQGTTTVSITSGNTSNAGITMVPLYAPSITGISSSPVTRGQPLTIYGSNFAPSYVSGITPTVYFQGVSASVTSFDNGQITVNVPSNAPSGNLVVYQDAVSSSGYSYTAMNPVVVSEVYTLTEGGNVQGLAFGWGGALFYVDQFNGIKKLTWNGSSWVYSTFHVSPCVQGGLAYHTDSGANYLYTTVRAGGGECPSYDGILRVSSDGTGVIIHGMASQGHNHGGVVFAGNDLYTPDLDQNAIMKIQGHGGGPSGLHVPSSFLLNGVNQIGFDASGNLYTANANAGTVSKILPTDLNNPTNILSGLGSPIGLVLDGSSNLLVSSFGDDNIVVRNPGGSVSTLVPSSAGLNSPSYMTFRQPGELWVGTWGDAFNPAKIMTVTF